MTEDSHDHMPTPLAPFDSLLEDSLLQREGLKKTFKRAVAGVVLAAGGVLAGPIGLLPGVALIGGYFVFSRLQKDNAPPQP